MKPRRPAKDVPGTPSTTRRTCSGVRRLNGRSTGMSSVSAAASRSSRYRRCDGVVHGAIAPCRIDLEQSGTIRSTVELGDLAQALADGAGSQRPAESEEVRLRLDMLGAAIGCIASRGRTSTPGPRIGDPASAEAGGEGPLDRVQPTLDRIAAADESVDDDLDRTGLGKAHTRFVEANAPAVGPGDSRESVGDQRAGQRLAVGLGEDVEREGDLIAGVRRQLVDRRRDGRRVRRVRPGHRSAGK